MPDKITVPVGLQDIYYAKLLSGDTATEAPVYETPKVLLPAITANITPNVESNTLHGNDGPIITANALGDIEVEIGVANLTLEQQADLLGATIDDDGLLWNNSDDQAPEVALGFRRSMSDGSFIYTWLLKGKFQLPTEEATTKQGEIEFQTPTITGRFLKRIFDNQWRVRADSNNTASAAKIATWFTKVPDSPKA
ncbi:phi13 family phage major tail protein [Paenibacillus sp. 4624]|uniref:major tail protein n=1 Tax=Paenibacillus sp. 4624 TaxID=3156453 RepID=UPI003D1AF153